MYTTNQVIAMTFLFASFGLALPVNPINPDIEIRSLAADAEATNLEITDVAPYLEGRDEEYSELDTRNEPNEPEEPEEPGSDLETRDEPNEPEEPDSDDFDLETREEEYPELEARNDPYNGKYANSQATRKQEIKNTNKGLSPDGKNGQQVAKQHGLKYDGDSGKKEYLEVANRGPLPENHGKNYENSLYSKASKNSQASKNSKASKASQASKAKKAGGH